MPSHQADENRITWTPSAAVLPMRTHQRGSRIGSAFAIAFGTVWCGGLLTSLVMGSLENGIDVPLILLLLLFTAPGAFILYFGLANLVARRETVLRSGSVEVAERRLRGDRRWQEPLSAYAGVLRRVQHHHSDGPGSRTEYEVVLVHADPRKTIPLYDSAGGAGWEAAWRHFAALLGVPRLEESAEGIYRVDDGAAARPARRTTPAAAAAFDLGRTVRVYRDTDGYRFRFPHYWTAWRGLLGLLIASAIALAAHLLQPAYADDPVLRVLVWVMYGFMAIALFSLLGSLRGYEELAVDRASVRYRRGTGRTARRQREETLAVAGLHSIILQSDPHRPGMPAQLVITGDDGVIRFGQWLRGATKRRLKAALLAALAEVSGRDVAALEPAIVLPRGGVAQRRALTRFALAGLAFFGVMVLLMFLAFDDRSPQPSRARPDQVLFEQWREAYNAGYAQYEQGHYPAARHRLDQARALGERLGEDSGALASTLYRLAQVAHAQRRFADAADLARRSLAIRRERGEHDRATFATRVLLAQALDAVGAAGEAETHFRAAIALGRELFSERPQPLHTVLRDYADFLQRHGRADEALALVQEAGPAPASPAQRQRLAIEAARARALAQREAQRAHRPSAQAPAAAPTASAIPSAVQKVPLALETLHPQTGRVDGAWNTRPITLTREPPAGVEALPTQVGALYGFLLLGPEESRFPFALVTEPAPARLYLDRNRNGDLGDDGAPLANQGSGVFAAELRLPFRTAVPASTRDALLRLWLFTNDHYWSRRQLVYYDKTQLVGRPLIGGREYLIAIAERGHHDGRFDNDGVYLDRNRDGKLVPPDEYLAPGSVVELNGRHYTFEPTLRGP